MIRILQCVNNMHRAGLETILMNYYRNIDRNQIQFDFLMHRNERSDYDDEIEALGGRIYRAPRLYPQNYPAYFAYMKRFFAEHPEYKIIHSHIDAMSYLPLIAAKKAGLPVRIAHSHSTSIDLDYRYLLKQVFRWQITKAANIYWTCGQAAGKFLFGSASTTFIPNAIDTARFVFSSDVRAQKRKELGIKENLFVVGHVGRFSYAKNHVYLLEIFQKFLLQKHDSVLMLVGTGEYEKKVKQLARELQIEEKVMFLESRSDVNELYQAMDVLVMPSLFEGVPVVGIEAQTAGLPCIFSDKVPSEVKFSDRVTFLPLNCPIELWVDTLLNAEITERDKAKEIHNPFDIKNAQQQLTNHYLQLIETLVN